MTKQDNDDRPSQDVSRFHSNRPADAAWRAQQAHVDADIEGLARDPEADRLVAELREAGQPISEQIERLKSYFIERNRSIAPRV